MEFSHARPRHLYRNASFRNQHAWAPAGRIRDVFGARKDQNNEALFFQDLNEWLLSQCGGRWDNPTPFNQYFWRSDEAVKWTELYIRNLLASPRRIQFLGARHALGGIGGLGMPWGWKDPRNTFTLPIWLRIFPDAKVVSIERNGIDVAQSLRAREIQFLEDAPRFYKKNRMAFFFGCGEAASHIRRAAWFSKTRLLSGKSTPLRPRR